MADAEIGAVGDLQGLLQGWQEGGFDVVKNVWHGQMVFTEVPRTKSQFPLR
jgi:hypothetical protein